MINFTYHNTTKIIFGKDTESQVGDEIKKFGNRVLLHYGEGSIKNLAFMIKSLNL
ncbi:NADH-dependent butanol dehydrogenase A [Clostridium colicanis DSM 13634]|uniref:NADH-dependent butanol dehydrogenase A n=1 Tax=Clostridium colicanis DSM 13634 TaxID=1121305 RepID=A0A151ALB2_9CLOT|nr:NADH-dependent butanol dehydrogenase A [Clostridium colicanis DSM 13634]